MPVPAPRDPGAARDILTGWLGDPARLPGARVTDLRTPEFTGFSSEILMADVEHGGGAEALAVRVAPSHYQVFPETRFAEQYRLMRILDSGTDIPVPPVLWYEPDPGYLGAPFIVMRRIDGRVPPDVPPYHTDGWVTEIGPAEREAMWWSGLDIVARLHRLDVTGLPRLLEEAVRVWPDGTSEYLGRPTYEPSYAEGTRDVVSARIGFSPPGGKPFDMEATLLLPVHLMVGLRPVRILGARRPPVIPLAAPFNIRQLTDVLRCKLQQHFRRKRHQSGR
jgi:hypothetical protein